MFMDYSKTLLREKNWLNLFMDSGITIKEINGRYYKYRQIRKGLKIESEYIGIVDISQKDMRKKLRLIDWLLKNQNFFLEGLQLLQELRNKSDHTYKQYHKYYKGGKKLCCACKRYQELNKFEKRALSYDGLSKKCSDCIEKKIKITMSVKETKKKRRCKSPEEKTYTRLRLRALKMKKEILKENDFIRWYQGTPDICGYCSIEKIEYQKVMLYLQGCNEDNSIKRIASKVNFSSRMTVDRINNDIGYLENNIIKSCWFCNSCKGSLLTYEDMKKLAPKLRRKITQLLK